MNADVLIRISTIAFALAILCAILAVVLFFYYKIPSVVNDLSGKNARRSIEELRKMNRESGNKFYSPKKKMECKKGTESIDTKGLNETESIDGTGTGILEENKMSAQTEGESTTLLEESTTLLEESTTLLDESTTLLTDDEENTQLLLEEDDNGTTSFLGEDVSLRKNESLHVIEEILFVHTDEVINIKNI